MRHHMKFCKAAEYFPKSTFQHFENWKIRARVFTKNMKGLSSDKKPEFSLELFYIKRDRAFPIFHYCVWSVNCFS